MIAITGHFERPRVKRLALRAKQLLEKQGAECVAADIKTKKFNSAKAKAVVAIGGDGTLLRVVRELEYSIPVIGIAAGRKSVLMQAKPASLGKTMKRLAGGKCRVEKRTRLQAFADGKRLPLALNEVMLLNRKSGELASFSLKVNGKSLGLVEADGLIVSTPTGSTGHAYSAGGKRIAVGSGKIAIVPSNALNRSRKPFYAKEGSTVEMHGFAKSQPGQSLEAVLDGRIRKAVKRRLLVKRGKDALFLKA